jgi:iron-sulfur cluster assembly protein
MLTLTKPAAEKVQKSITKRGHGVGIRVGVRTTGCSGLAYVLEYIDKYVPDDSTINYSQDQFVVIIDKKDVPYLNGIEIDYVRQGLNEGFEFNNPNERDRCGCGESFRV